MAILQLAIGGTEGSQVLGLHRQVISGQAATVTLTEAQSGALCLFDRAAGIVYTLPSLASVTVGTNYEFLVTVSVTSNAHKVITNVIASQFIVGAVTMVTIATASPAGFSANGTSIAALSANGTTSGGLIGETYRITALSATLWGISGVTVGSGTIITPFAVS